MTVTQVLEAPLPSQGRQQEAEWQGQPGLKPALQRGVPTSQAVVECTVLHRCLPVVSEVDLPHLLQDITDYG